MYREKKENSDKETEVAELPAHVRTFDPENPPFSIHRLCIYLRELEEEKEHK
jgi:hypothetical protein